MGDRMTRRTEEERLRAALRWYPRHIRQAYGEEIVATALELHEAGGGGPRPGPELVRAGLAARVRNTPGPLRRAGYRLLGIAPPARYRAWAAADLADRRYPLRVLLWSLLWLVPIAALSVGGPLYAGIDPWGDEHTLGLLPKAAENAVALGTPVYAFVAIALFLGPLDRDGLRRRQGLPAE